MSLRFLLGRAGTGKTHICLTEVVNTLEEQGENGPPLILLVPEQATFQMERALLARVAAGATTRAQVLSFRRLAQRVLLEAGGETKPPLDELGKRLLLRRVLMREQQSLVVLARSARRPGLVAHLSRLLTELCNHRVDAADLEAAAAEIAAARSDSQASLPARLGDLAHIMRAFDAAVPEGYSNPDRRQRLVAERLPQAASLRGCRIWIDGFAGFTPSEYATLSALFTISEQMTIALCLDARRHLGHEPDENDPFRQTHLTYLRISNLARRAGIKVEPVRVLDEDGPPHRFRGRPRLARIEHGFLRAQVPPWPQSATAPPVADDESVELIRAADPHQEVEAVAARIRELLREHRLRPRDIAVIVRNFDPYESWIRRVFPDYGIPFFIDRKGSLTHHPLVEGLRSALEAVATDWSSEAVLRYLKTGLIPIDTGAIDRIENYVLQHGIEGRLWYNDRPWRFRRRYSLEVEPEDSDSTPEYQLPADLQIVNDERRQAIGHLQNLHRQLMPARAGELSVGEMTRSLYTLLVELGVPQRLADWAAAAEADGDLVAAGEHRQAWDGVVRVFEAMVEMLGDELMTLNDYRQMLEAGLEQLQLALIPPALDQVLVGAIERSRQPDVEVAFVMGANEGVFPATPREDVLLGDADRQALVDTGLELAPDSKRRLFHERYLAYIALTRPRERLVVSYAATDGSGGELRPSPIITRLRQLLPDLTPRPAGEHSEPRQFEHPGRLAGAALTAFRRTRGPHRQDLDLTWWGAWAWLSTHPQHRSQLQHLAKSLAEPQPQPKLPRRLATELYGAELRTSVSRLERFAACPFQHFAHDVLGLEERSRADLDPARLGSILHAAMRLLLEQLPTDAEQLADRQPSDWAALVDDVVSKLITLLEQEMFLGSARQAYVLDRLRAVLRWALQITAEHYQRGDFRPIATEVAFGMREPGSLPPLRIKLDEQHQVLFRGRIDRVDVAEIAGETWLRIIDYKSSQRSLSLFELRHGLALQLLAYLAVAWEHSQVWLGRQARLAGAYYMPLFEPVVEAAPEDEQGRTASKRRNEVKLAGITVAEPDVIRAMDRHIDGRSELVQVALTNDGRPYKSGSVAPESDLHDLLNFVRQQIAELAEAVFAGTVAARPYRNPNGDVPCGSCAYSAVCRFEGVHGRHRDLAAVDPASFWREVRGE